MEGSMLDALCNNTYPLIFLCGTQVISARVAELVDALVLGTSIIDVWVRVPPLAPLITI